MGINEEVFTLPKTPSAFDTFQTTFVTFVAAKWQDVGIPSEDVTKLQTFQQQWTPVHALCANSNTTSVANRAAQKDLMTDYGAEVKDVVRKYIIGNAAVSAEVKSSLNINPRNLARKRKQAPTTCPELHIDASQPGVHIINFRDAGTQGRFAKGKGIAYCDIVYQIDGTAPTLPDDLKLHFTASRKGERIAFATDQKGKEVYYFGRWINDKGQAGGWSDIVSQTIH